MPVTCCPGQSRVHSATCVGRALTQLVADSVLVVLQAMRLLWGHGTIVPNELGVTWSRQADTLCYASHI